MPTLADVFRAHRADYQAQHSLSFLERKTIEALLACRSGSYGSTLYQCSDCGQKHFIHRSCGNHHCPASRSHVSSTPDSMVPNLTRGRAAS